MYKIILFFLLIAAFAGCTNSRYSSIGTSPIDPGMPSTGVYHIIEKGQTLWSISRKYGVNLQLLTSINKIEDFSKIETE